MACLYPAMIRDHVTIYRGVLVHNQHAARVSSFFLCVGLYQCFLNVTFKLSTARAARESVFAPKGLIGDSTSDGTRRALVFVATSAPCVAELAYFLKCEKRVKQL